MARLKFAMVCYSNQNRSMEAHKVLADAGFDVDSYGVGTCVRLPGPNRFEPNVYEFGTPYKAILADLRSKPAKDQPHYERLGLISMLERNLKIKEAPERWQDAELAEIDVVVTFEETIMDALVEDMQQRLPGTLHPVLVVNLEVTDNNREALAAAPQVSLHGWRHRHCNAVWVAGKQGLPGVHAASSPVLALCCLKSAHVRCRLHACVYAC